MNGPALIPIRFYEAHPPYNAGEVAGKPYAEARALVKRGRAVYLTPPPGVDDQGVPLPEPDTEDETGTANGD